MRVQKRNIPKAKREREKVGDYEILKHPGGGFSVFGPGLSKNGFYLPSDSKITEEYHYQAEHKERKGHSKFLTMKIKLRALLEGEKPNYTVGKKALGLPTRSDEGMVFRLTSLDEIRSTIREYWPEDKVNEFIESGNEILAPEEFGLGRIKDFSIKHRRQFHASHRTHGGLEEVMNSMGEPYDGLYRRIQLRRSGKREIKPEKLREKILKRFYLGLPVNKAYLQNSDLPSENDLLYDVLKLAGQEGHYNYTQTVMALTGLKRKDIEVSVKARKEIAKISEALTGFLFSWAPLVGVDLEDIINEEGEIVRNYDKGRTDILKFNYTDNHGERVYGLPDLRIGNTAIEVKNGFFVPTKKMVEDLVRRYAHEKNKWSDGNKMTDNVLVLNQRDSLYLKYLDEIKDAGIRVFRFEDFNERLKEVIRRIKTDFKGEIAEFRPRIHSLDYLVDIHEEVSLRPATLVRGEDHENTIGKNVNEKRIYRLISDLDGRASTDMVVKKSSDSKNNIHRVISSLSESGLIRGRVNGSTTYWSAVEQPTNYTSRLTWSLDSLRRLSDLAEKIKEDKSQTTDKRKEPAPYVKKSLGSLGIHGERVEKNKHGKYVVIERDSSDFKDSPIGRALEKYMPNIKRRNMREALSVLNPEAAGLYRDNVMVFDVENCGLNMANPIFMIGMAHLNHEVKPEILFARDPSEEKAILYAFLERVGEYMERDHSGFITYNGESFDVPRITSRARHNGLLFNGNSDLGEWFGKQHFDLYKIARKIKGRFGLRRAQLANIEGAICGENTRQEDVSGEIIPKIYREWLYGVDEAGNRIDETSCLKNLAQVTDHLMYDVLSPIAFLGYLCSEKSS